MIPGQELAVGSSCIHVSKSTFQCLAWKHGDVFEAERLEYALVKVLVERYAGCALNTEPSPVYADLASSSAQR